MLVISLDVSGLIARLEKMTEKLEQFPDKMADELTAWQVEDMHRHYPNTEKEGNAVTTEIWPRGRPWLENNQKKINSIMRARRKAGRPVFGPVRKGTHRPILREELFVKLCERMDALMAKELTWR
jgi:hypothetical protein